MRGENEYSHLISIAVLLLALITQYSLPGGSVAHTDQGKMQRRKVAVPLGDFSLTDQGSRAFRFKDLTGKVVVVAFAYTTCPDVCPLITAAMRRVQGELSPAESQSVQLLTVTTDPEVDSPAVLAAYAKRYNADLSNWAFLTGDERLLARVWKNFGVGVKRKSRGLVDHTPLTAIVDQKGVIRFAYYGSAPDPQVIVEDLRSLLNRR